MHRAIICVPLSAFRSYQIRDALRAAGDTPEQVIADATSVEKRIAELNQLKPIATPR
jgi:hypothetical protein